MRIKAVRIRNFRTLKDVTIAFDSVTTFIGPNGTGKSTVLRALDWFFNGKPGSLGEDDCSFGATDQDIEVQVTFDSLTPKDRDELGKYATVNVGTFTAWKHRSPDGAEVMSANSKGLAEFTSIKTAVSATKKKELYGALRGAREDLALPAANSAVAIDQAITDWEAAHTEKLVATPETLTNFFGFNSGGKLSGLFDFVLVTADLRASEESLDGKASIIGRILERSIDRAAADEEVAKIVEDSRARQQKVYEDKFEAQLAVMTSQLNDVVTSYSPGRTIAVTPSEVELKAPRTTFDVAVLDGMTSTAVERQGHGFQRTLLISALQLLAQSGSASAEGVICLALEEPELFQHPIQAHTFAKVLRSLAEDAGKRVQVTYATHSPYFVEARHFDQVRRLTRSTDIVPEVMVHFASIAEIRTRLSGVVKESTVDRQLDGIVTNQLAVALFAHRAFVVEGTTEASVFYGLGDRVAVGSLESKGLAIVSVGGKTSIPLAHAILEELGIPAYALFDGDGGFEARASANGKDEGKIVEERRNHISANRSVLKYFNLAEVDFPETQVSETVAIFDDHLEAFLAANWPEWGVSCASVEAAAGMSLAKNQLAYRTATLEAEGEVPDVLARIASKAEGIEHA